MSRAGKIWLLLCLISRTDLCNTINRGNDVNDDKMKEWAQIVKSFSHTYSKVMQVAILVETVLTYCLETIEKENEKRAKKTVFLSSHRSNHQKKSSSIWEVPLSQTQIQDQKPPEPTQRDCYERWFHQRIRTYCRQLNHRNPTRWISTVIKIINLDLIIID